MSGNKPVGQIILEKLHVIEEKQDKLHKRLFMDNGEPCLQSKINKNTLYIKWMVGIFSTIGVAIISVVGKLVNHQWGP
jgi:hypothetical protein